MIQSEVKYSIGAKVLRSPKWGSAVVVVWSVDSLFSVYMRNLYPPADPLNVRGYACSPFWPVRSAEPHLMLTFPLSPHYIPPKEVWDTSQKQHKRINPVVNDSTAKCNEIPTGHRLHGLRPSFSVSPSFLPIRVVLCSQWAFALLWEIGSWFPGHFVVVVAFSFDLILVATFDTWRPLMESNHFYDIWMLNSASFICHSSDGRRRRLFLCSIRDVHLQCADDYCIVDRHICWYFQFECIWPTDHNDYEGSCPQVLQLPPRWVLVRVCYWQVSSTQHHEVCHFKVHRLRLLFATAIWRSCASRRMSWASSNEPCNRSTNNGVSSLRNSSCCHWHATMSEGMDGVYPRSNLNGLRSADECVDVLYAYCTSGTIVSHWSWWRVVMACRYCVTSLFEMSASPSVCGWNAIDMSSVVCNLLLTSAQKSDLKRMSLPLTISPGTPWSCMMASQNTCANSAASMVLVQCIQWARLEKWSTKVTMQSFPLKDVGTSVMKSTPTSSQQPRATGSGFNMLTTFPAHWLTHAHMSQPFVLSCTPVLIPGQKKCCLTAIYVFAAPKWPPTAVSCASQSTLFPRGVGM